MSRIKTPITERSRTILGIIGAIVLCIAYEFVSYQQHLNNPLDTTIPTFYQLFDGIGQIIQFHDDNDLAKAFGIEVEESSFFEKVSTTYLWKDSVATYGRLFEGLILGCTFSILVGVLMGCYEWLAALLLPALSFLSKIPGTSMLAVFFVMAGTGEIMFVTMISFGILPTLTQSVYLSAKNDLHIEEINKGYTLGASNFEVIVHIVFQKILPNIIDSVRLQIGPAMVYLIAAEMLAGQVGIGYQIRVQQRLLNMAVVYDYIIFLGLTGLLMDRMSKLIQRYLCPWYGNKVDY